MTAYELVFVKRASSSAEMAKARAEAEAIAQQARNKALGNRAGVAASNTNRRGARKTPKMEIVVDKKRTQASMPRKRIANPQVGSTAYDDPDQAYNYFLSRGVPADQARAAADTIGAYNVQMRRGADHATAMSIINHGNVRGGNSLNSDYHAQIIDHLNRRYHTQQLRAEDKAYGIPAGSDPRTRQQVIRREARDRAAVDNNKHLNPRNYDRSDALRRGLTYVSHGNQVVDPASGRVNRKATSARRNAAASSRNRAYANNYRTQGYRVNSRGQLVYGE